MLIATVIFSALVGAAHAVPFTVDGSTVYVSGGSVGINTSSPTATLDVNGTAQFGSGATRSTFTATGLLKVTASGVQWADGTTSTTAATSSSVQGSTWSYVTINSGAYSTAQGSFMECVTGSTVTITTTGGLVIVSNTGGTYGSGLANVTRVSFMVDGGFATGLNSTTSASLSNNGTDGASGHINIFWPITGLSAGQHNFCLAIANDSNWTIYVGNNSGNTAVSRFGVMEIR